MHEIEDFCVILQRSSEQMTLRVKEWHSVPKGLVFNFSKK